MFLFEEDLSIYGVDEENRVLKKANEKAEEYYNKDYDMYLSLADLANLMESRYQRVREQEETSVDLEELFIETKSILNMDKYALVNRCKEMKLKTSGNKEDLRSRLVEEFEKKFNY